MNSKSKLTSLYIFVPIPGILIAIILVTLISGCGNARSPSANGAVDNNHGAPLLDPEYVQEIVAYSLGEAVRVRHVTISGGKTEMNVDIGVDRPVACGDGSVVGTMTSFTQKVIPNLFEYPEISNVSMAMYGVEQGVKGDDIAIKVVLNRTTAQDMDWFMFGPMTMSSMVTGYYIHPRILANSKF